ncbi:MAG: hypothetical protein QM666_07180 [Acinetobacter sp.]
MNMEYTHEPNYFFFAHKLALFLQDHAHKHPQQHADFNLQTIYDLFGQDRASSTVNLEGILNIADEYRVNDQVLIHHYHIHYDTHVLHVEFNIDALPYLVSGATLTYPQVA